MSDINTAIIGAGPGRNIVRFQNDSVIDVVIIDDRIQAISPFRPYVEVPIVELKTIDHLFFPETRAERREKLRKLNKKR